MLKQPQNHHREMLKVPRWIQTGWREQRNDPEETGSDENDRDTKTETQRCVTATGRSKEGPEKDGKMK